MSSLLVCLKIYCLDTSLSLFLIILFVCLEHDLVYFSKNHNKHWERRRVNAKAGEQRHLLPSVMVSILVTPG